MPHPNHNIGPSSTVGELLRFGQNELKHSDTPRLDSELLLAAAMQSDRAQLFRDSDQSVDRTTTERFSTLLVARASGKPVAQLLGQTEFWSLGLVVNDSVLVPRPETEHLVEAALACIENLHAPYVADLGTGSGAVALAVATERPDVTLIACDRSMAALEVAAHNRDRLALDNVALVQSHWLSACAPQQFDLIVANPPYLQSDDPLLSTSDIRFEPYAALASGPDGLHAIREIIDEAPRVMQRNAWLALEHGSDQGAATRALFIDKGFIDVSSADDLAGHERVTAGQWQPDE